MLQDTAPVTQAVKELGEHLVEEINVTVTVPNEKEWRIEWPKKCVQRPATQSQSWIGACKCVLTPGVGALQLHKFPAQDTQKLSENCYSYPC